MRDVRARAIHFGILSSRARARSYQFFVAHPFARIKTRAIDDGKSGGGDSRRRLRARVCEAQKAKCAAP